MTSYRVWDMHDEKTPNGELRIWTPTEEGQALARERGRPPLRTYFCVGTRRFLTRAGAERFLAR